MERQVNQEDRDVLRHFRSVAGAFFSFGLGMLAIQITACTVVLARSEHEKPNAPLRTYIIGNLSGCVAFLVLLVVDYICQRRALELMAADNVEDDLENSPVYAKIQIASIIIKGLLSTFFTVWFIIGCVWVSQAYATRSDAPQLFWLSMAFVILGASGFALGVIVGFFMCCCLPCIMACFG